ncbi:hypothetical protein LY76DRAFT_66730 [Colletotrichum caudatum]|nr:hypothetical protein LY76DRAFT_66730 [Colletotrichum caudatum]
MSSSSVVVVESDSSVVIRVRRSHPLTKPHVVACCAVKASGCYTIYTASFDSPLPSPGVCGSSPARPVTRTYSTCDMPSAFGPIPTRATPPISRRPPLQPACSGRSPRFSSKISRREGAHITPPPCPLCAFPTSSVRLRGPDQLVNLNRRHAFVAATAAQRASRLGSVRNVSTCRAGRWNLAMRQSSHPRLDSGGHD